MAHIGWRLRKRGTQESNLALRFWRPPIREHPALFCGHHCRPVSVLVSEVVPGFTVGPGAPTAASPASAPPGLPGPAACVSSHYAAAIRSISACTCLAASTTSWTAKSCSIERA